MVTSVARVLIDGVSVVENGALLGIWSVLDDAQLHSDGGEAHWASAGKEWKGGQAQFEVRMGEQFRWELQHQPGGLPVVLEERH